MLSGETGVGSVLCGFFERDRGQVASIIRGDFHNVALAQIVSSQLDADRMDYLLRDSLMTGAKYGIYDLEWVIKSIEMDEDAGSALCLDAGNLRGRRLSSGSILHVSPGLFSPHAALGRGRAQGAASPCSRALSARERRSGTGPIRHFEKVLRGEHLSLSEHLSIDDYGRDVLYQAVAEVGRPVLSDLSSRFLDRRLFKAFDLDMPENDVEQFVTEARRIVANAGYDPEYYFVDDKGGDAPYYFYTQNPDDPKNLIYVEDGYARPSIREISEVSAAVRGLQKGYRIHRICFPSELKR